MASTRHALILSAVLAPTVSGLDNGLARTPAMGFNTWNVFRCGGVTAAAIEAVADHMLKLGLVELGYTYLNIDDCWSTDLAADGALVADPVAFPGGIGAVADAVHARGLKLGIYSDRGMLTCAGRPASGGREQLHARQFAEWGIDYLKYDSCWASNRHATAFEQYGRMRDALNATGRPILFSLCGWNAWYAPRGSSLGNSWRVAPDTDEWSNVYVAVRTNERLGAFAAPGAFNDPDMLVGSNPAAPVHFTPAQVQTQFSLWAVMAAPLLLGAPLEGMPPSDLATYSNEEVIAIDQDVLGVQGRVVWSNCPPFEPRDNWWMSPWSMPLDVALMWTQALAALLCVLGGLSSAASRGLFPRSGAVARGEDVGLPYRCLVLLARALRVLLATLAVVILLAIWGSRPKLDPCQMVWARPLAAGEHALCFVNFAEAPATVECDEACMAQLARSSSNAAAKFRVRDAVGRTDLEGERTSLAVTLDGDGASALYRLVPA